MEKQSRLEEEAFEYRENAVKNEYIREFDEYSELHKNALSDGDKKGKGTGQGGPTYIIPDRTKSKTQIKPTLITDRGGSSVDIKMREDLEMKNLYGKLQEYGPQSVDTTNNVKAGQFVVK